MKRGSYRVKNNNIKKLKKYTKKCIINNNDCNKYVRYKSKPIDKSKRIVKCIICGNKRNRNEMVYSYNMCKECCQDDFGVFNNDKLADTYSIAVINNRVKESFKLQENFYQNDYRGYYKVCSKCGNKKHHSKFHKNKTQLSGLASACAKCKTKVITKSTKKRLKTDTLFKFRISLSCITSQAFKNRGYKKTSKTHELLGDDFKTVFNHIEKQFVKGMNWDNHTKKGWHIDHIIPLASANTEEELIRLCHYTNLQPLWAKDNIIKSDKIPLVSQI